MRSRMSATVTVKKHKDMEKMLREFDRETVDEVREYILKRARKYVPIDTGKLKSSIRLMQRYTVGSTVRYAGFQEYGTVHNRAQPYMRPALEDAERMYPTIFNEVWRKAAR